MITASRETVGRRAFSLVAVLEDPRTGKQISLAGYATSIGRCKYNNICVEDITASRQHALIYYKNGSYFIQDLDSRNGTKVDGLAVKDAPVELLNGSKILVGLTQFVFITRERRAHSGVSDTAEIGGVIRAQS